MMKNDKAMFKAADKNHDDKLSKEEHLHFNQPEDYPEMFPLILQNTLDEKDMNKDGAIDFQEFIGEKGTFFRFSNIYQLLKSEIQGSFYEFKMYDVLSYDIVFLPFSIIFYSVLTTSHYKFIKNMECLTIAVL